MWRCFSSMQNSTDLRAFFYCIKYLHNEAILFVFVLFWSLTASQCWEPISHTEANTTGAKQRSGGDQRYPQKTKIKQQTEGVCVKRETICCQLLINPSVMSLIYRCSWNCQKKAAHSFLGIKICKKKIGIGHWTVSFKMLELQQFLGTLFLIIYVN